jgi:CheY-like chemotaxis protein
MIGQYFAQQASSGPRTDGGVGTPLGRVLIVDDELPVRLLLTRMLRNWGYAIRHVGSANEALDVMAAEPADVLLCDVSMPEHDGLWLAEHVHGRWPRTAIIMSTGLQDAHTIQASRKLGAVAYVTKPFNPYMLREALERVSAVYR